MSKTNEIYNQTSLTNFISDPVYGKPYFIATMTEIADLIRRGDVVIMSTPLGDKEITLEGMSLKGCPDLRFAVVQTYDNNRGYIQTIYV